MDLNSNKINVFAESIRTSIKTFLVDEDNINTVLGCWIINHNFNGVNNNGSVNVNGTYDIKVLKIA